MTEAANWASKHLNKTVSVSNISYLVQYGKIRKYGENGGVQIDLDDLEKYYDSWHGKREIKWKNKLGDDLNWGLSFDHLREKDTTKHVHRLHPYKGKFIPQLVEYFIDEHTDDYKREVFFHKDDVVLDPFLGSGTTIIQCLEMGINSIGIDISEFNCMISRCKANKYNFDDLKTAIDQMLSIIKEFENRKKIKGFETELLSKLSEFNSKNFPGHDFRYKLNQGIINEDSLAKNKEQEFQPIYDELIRKYEIKLFQTKRDSFLDTWYVNNVREEINLVFEVIKKQSNKDIKQLLALILSRTIRSCRATTHSDLATLKEPQFIPYYCYKHKKICKPIFSIETMLKRYSLDTFNRVKEFNLLRKPALFSVISGDSRNVDILSEIKRKNGSLYNIISGKLIDGIFSSPPYVGQIDYHEQHAYAYDLFGFNRNDQLEIGPLSKGQNQIAKEEYVEGISSVLINCKNYLKKDFNIFLVANDKFNLYPVIAQKSGLKIVNNYKRPVLNRTERDRNPYSEIIFHMREQE